MQLLLSAFETESLAQAQVVVLNTFTSCDNTLYSFSSMPKLINSVAYELGLAKEKNEDLQRRI